MGSWKKRLYLPGSIIPFEVSRTKLELFMKCPRCFFLDRRTDLSTSSDFGLNLNLAVDALLKKEFDIYRAQRISHPLMVQYGIDAIPFSHPDLDIWRENFKGIRFLHTQTNLIIFGAVDDIWVGPDGTLFVVDYKATSTSQPITLDGGYGDAYKRQIEVYQWLLRRNGFKVSDTGYFVYENATKDRDRFDAKLEFKEEIIPYTGNDAWIEPVIFAAYSCLNGTLPPTSPSCGHCKYTEELIKILRIRS
ncbi:MAG: PD-(D/E)XK nuclease family protein [Parcubacteria group bacterium]|nr:PD-(D/E)XK nuclease family protein [Parcubacteria group bacterium]